MNKIMISRVSVGGGNPFKSLDSIKEEHIRISASPLRLLKGGLRYNNNLLNNLSKRGVIYG